MLILAPRVGATADQLSVAVKRLRQAERILVDRLVHRSEIDRDSFRLEEAKERQSRRSASRSNGKKRAIS